MRSRNIRRTVHLNPQTGGKYGPVNPAMQKLRASSIAMFDNRSGATPQVYGSAGDSITSVSAIEGTYTGLYGEWDTGTGDMWTLPAPAAGVEQVSTWWIVAAATANPGSETNLIGRRVTQAANSLGWVLLMEAGGTLRLYMGDGSNNVNPDAGAISVPVDGTPFVAAVGILQPAYNFATLSTYDATNGFQSAQGSMTAGDELQDDAIATGWGGNASADGPEWFYNILGGGYSNGYVNVGVVNASLVATAFGIL